MRKNVLIVDDDDANLSLLVAMLSSANEYQVITAKDGVTALRLASAAKPDLVLLDVVLPGLDGFDVCRSLRRLPETCDVPILFLTAMAQDSHRAAGMAAGADAYITKPFSPIMLLSTLHSLVSPTCNRPAETGPPRCYCNS